MNRTTFYFVCFILVLALTAAVGVQAAPMTTTKADKQLKISKLSALSQRKLRLVGVTGKTMSLVGTPKLTGSKLDGLSIYRATWARGGQCVSGVFHGRLDGADCDAELLTAKRPGYASAGIYKSVIIAPGRPGQPPKTKDTILQVYGVALPSVKAVRLVGPTSGSTVIPLLDAGTGFVVFGSANPPEDGKMVEFLNAAGSVVQTIRIAPSD